MMTESKNTHVYRINVYHNNDYRDANRAEDGSLYENIELVNGGVRIVQKKPINGYNNGRTGTLPKTYSDEYQYVDQQRNSHFSPISNTIIYTNGQHDGFSNDYNHTNGFSNEYMNGRQPFENGQVNGYFNGQLNGLTNGHGKTHLNGYIKGCTNDHQKENSNVDEEPNTAFEYVNRKSMIVGERPELQNVVEPATVERSSVPIYPMKFHLNELANVKLNGVAQEKEKDLSFTGRSLINGNFRENVTITSATGSVRGVRNRVRAGIETFKNRGQNEVAKVSFGTDYVLDFQKKKKNIFIQLIRSCLIRLYVLDFQKKNIFIQLIRSCLITFHSVFYFVCRNTMKYL